MNAIRYSQTKERPRVAFGLPVSAGIMSPFQIGRDNRIHEIKTMKALVIGYRAQAPSTVDFYLWDNSNTFIAALTEQFTLASTDTTSILIRTAINTGIIAGTFADTGLTIAATDIQYMSDILDSNSMVSYQTIVSQTGTSAPAVSGSLSPVNTYPSGTTFAWARTSAGVYTLTASAAVFNTSGKTAVFVGPLNNLNGAVTAVVTSSTVITITTAVQSLAVLGLLGFTATPTDALLTKAMVYVQTYA